jgi:signal transduction histidine kinase
MNGTPHGSKSLALQQAQTLRSFRMGVLLVLGVAITSSVAAALLPEGFALALFGDSLQLGLVATAAVLSLQNAFRNHSQVRTFWLLIFVGCAMWLVSLSIWSVYELILHQSVPDSPLADTLLFVKLVPFTLAAALEPQKNHDSRLRAFGLLDLSILILYSLYLFAFFVYAYRLLPGAIDIYNYHFNVADLIANQLLAIVTAAAFFGERGPWRGVFRAFFFAAATYSLASDLDNVAIDLGRYYTGSFYDIPLVAAMAGFVTICLAGRAFNQPHGSSESTEPSTENPSRKSRFLLSHLTILVTLSTPVIGLWLLASKSSPAPIFQFRLSLTLLTIFLLTLLLSVKQQLLSTKLVGSLQHLSGTYQRIERFQDHLVQSEKLASLGRLVANVANEIKDAMTRVHQQALRITSNAKVDSRSHSLAGKIGQYAQRTDALVENMLRFAQETPLQLAPVEVKPLLESALHLSRISKNPSLLVDLHEEGPCPPVLADSSQLLHVFVQLIANAMDALEEAGGGRLSIGIRVVGAQVSIEVADNGPGVKQPEHIFEPFFTTKPVGKGTGMGLSTCYGIIQQHEGEIVFKNRPQGGASFTVFLPASPTSAPAEVETVPALQERPR